MGSKYCLFPAAQAARSKPRLKVMVIPPIPIAPDIPVDPRSMGSVTAQAPLAKLTTLRVGGSADYLILPKTPQQLLFVLNWGQEKGLPITLLGAGSNLLISDQGLPGLVICTRALRHSEFDPITGQVIAAAGEPWSSLAWKAARQGLKGFEWTIGIPGTVGGAVVMNAGAHGGETADLLIETEVVSPNGAIAILKPEDLGFRYRTSKLQGSNLIVTTATFQLSPGYDPAEIKAATATDLKSRREPSLTICPTAAAFFAIRPVSMPQVKPTALAA